MGAGAEFPTQSEHGACSPQVAHSLLGRVEAGVQAPRAHKPPAGLVPDTH